MARHYSPKNFFRQMPAALLGRYFRERECNVELDVTLPKAELQKAIWDAWLMLPDEQRKAIDSDFHEISGMSCESGFRAIIDEAEWQFCALDGNPSAHVAFVETLSALPNHFERAMHAFLDHQRFWKGATPIRCLSGASAEISRACPLPSTMRASPRWRHQSAPTFILSRVAATTVSLSP
jgi:hypothetical protein